MANTYETKVSPRKNRAGDYVVKLFKNGQHVVDADYFTPDKADAVATAQAMYEHAQKNQT